MRVSQIAGAVLGAVALQFLLTMVFTGYFPGSEGAYGAPFSVGYSCGFCIVELGAGGTFLWTFFALDVAVTAVVFWMLMRLGGHVLLVPLGGVLFLLLAMVMYFTLPTGTPFAGLPVPIAIRHPRIDYPRVALLALWIDCMVGAAVFAVPSMLRRRLGSRPTTPAVRT